MPAKSPAPGRRRAGSIGGPEALAAAKAAATADIANRQAAAAAALRAPSPPPVPAPAPAPAPARHAAPVRRAAQAPAPAHRAAPSTPSGVGTWFDAGAISPPAPAQSSSHQNGPAPGPKAAAAAAIAAAALAAAHAPPSRHGSGNRRLNLCCGIAVEIPPLPERPRGLRMRPWPLLRRRGMLAVCIGLAAALALHLLVVALEHVAGGYLACDAADSLVEPVCIADALPAIVGSGAARVKSGAAGLPAPAAGPATPTRPLWCLERDVDDCFALQCRGGLVSVADAQEQWRRAPLLESAAAVARSKASGPWVAAAGSLAARSAGAPAVFDACASSAIAHGSFGRTAAGVDGLGAVLRASVLLPASLLRLVLSAVQPLAAARTGRLVEVAFGLAVTAAALVLE